jgi:hypothetical protein
MGSMQARTTRDTAAATIAAWQLRAHGLAAAPPFRTFQVYPKDPGGHLWQAERVVVSRHT